MFCRNIIVMSPMQCLFGFSPKIPFCVKRKSSFFTILITIFFIYKFKSTCKPVELTSDTNITHVCRKNISIKLGNNPNKQSCLTSYNNSIILILKKLCGDRIWVEPPQHLIALTKQNNWLSLFCVIIKIKLI